MRVLGVDPGLARTGVAVVVGDAGRMRLLHAACIETPAGTPDASRLAMLDAALLTLLRDARVDAAAVEQLFFASNRRSAIQVAQARGVALCALARAGVAVSEYTPLQVKESVAGYGAAEKSQVARLVHALLGVDTVPGPDDVTDACAVAITHHHRSRLGSARRRSVAVTGGRSRLAAAVAAGQALQARQR